jgi:alpha-N-acetylglucosamine transferase
MREHQIKSAALRRASWNTYLDPPKYSPRRILFARRRRAFVSSLHTESYQHMALALGYSLTQTNDIDAQNAEMVLFVRKAANISTKGLNKLKRVGWNLRIEDDIVLEGVDQERISSHHRYNLNKLRFWSWTKYDQILFIDADTLVKRDLSEVWNTPGSKIPLC